MATLRILGNAENQTWGRWVLGKNTIHCAMRPPPLLVILLVVNLGFYMFSVSLSLTSFLSFIPIFNHLTLQSTLHDIPQPLLLASKMQKKAKNGQKAFLNRVFRQRIVIYKCGGAIYCGQLVEIGKLSANYSFSLLTRCTYLVLQPTLMGGGYCVVQCTEEAIVLPVQLSRVGITIY